MPATQPMLGRDKGTGNKSELSSLNGELAVVELDQTASGNITALNGVVTLSGLQGTATVTVQVTGTFVATLTPKINLDNTNYVSMNSASVLNVGTGAYSSTITAAGVYQIDVSGFSNFQLLCTSFTSGTAVVTMRASAAPGLVALDNPIPAGGNAIGTVTAVGSAAHGASISGNPVRQGGRAVTANYTAVTSGQVADFIATAVGAQIVKPYAIPEQDFQYSGTVTVTTDTAMKAAGSAGIRNYLTAVQITNGAATATTVTIKDGTTAIWVGYLPATIGAQISVQFPTPLKTTAASALNIAFGTATTAYVSAQGFQAP